MVEEKWSWSDLKVWTEAPERTVWEFQSALRALSTKDFKLSTRGKKEDLKKRLLGYIATRPLNAEAGWSPKTVPVTATKFSVSGWILVAIVLLFVLVICTAGAYVFFHWDEVSTWIFTRNSVAVQATSSPVPTRVVVKSATEPADVRRPVMPMSTVTLTLTTASTVTPTAVSMVVTGTTNLPLYAMKLEKGKSVIPSWGYGPWAPSGVVVPKAQPGGQVPLGLSQPVTDFNGRNWVGEGEWKYNLPSGTTEIWVTVQGDAPAQVEWTGNSLVLRTSADISKLAPDAKDNAPHQATGSSGVSLVVYVR